MIKLTDFKVGDSAYMLAERTDGLKRVEVDRIGRKYLTLSNGKRFSEQSAYEFCLADNYEYGARHYLFKTVDDYEKHIRKNEVIRQFRDFTSRYRLEMVQYQKLKEALFILKGGAE